MKNICSGETKIGRLIKTDRLKINSPSDNAAIFLDIIQVQRHVVADFLIIRGLFLKVICVRCSLLWQEKKGLKYY